MTNERNPHEWKYRELIGRTLQGDSKASRGAPSVEIFGVQIEFDLAEGSAVFTGRKLYPRGVWGELAAFLEGATNVSDFEKHGCNYWKQWAAEDGDLGPIYGYQWRYWGDSVDQIHQLKEMLRSDPESRRMVVSAWNPSDTNKMGLPPCHYAMQFRRRGVHLDVLVTMRSLDLMVGFPSDVILYETLLRLAGGTARLIPGRVIFSIGSCHIYEPHIDQALDYLSRPVYEPPCMLTRGMDLDNYDPSTMALVDYKHGDSMQLELFG